MKNNKDICLRHLRATEASTNIINVTKNVRKVRC